MWCDWWNNLSSKMLSRISYEQKRSSTKVVKQKICEKQPQRRLQKYLYMCSERIHIYVQKGRVFERKKKPRNINIVLFSYRLASIVDWYRNNITYKHKHQLYLRVFFFSFDVLFIVIVIVIIIFFGKTKWIVYIYMKSDRFIFFISHWHNNQFSFNDWNITYFMVLINSIHIRIVYWSSPWYKRNHF